MRRPNVAACAVIRGRPQTSGMRQQPATFSTDIPLLAHAAGTSRAPDISPPGCPVQVETLTRISEDERAEYMQNWLQRCKERAARAEGRARVGVLGPAWEWRRQDGWWVSTS